LKEFDKAGHTDEIKREKVYGLGWMKKFGFNLRHLVGLNLDPDVKNVVKLKLVFVPAYLHIHLSRKFTRK
jgi:TnpA family transposase